MSELPTEQGYYLDREGDLRRLVDGQWVFPESDAFAGKHERYAPFTRLLTEGEWETKRPRITTAQLAAVLDKWAQAGDDGDENIVAAGWKSPAEVAELKADRDEWKRLFSECRPVHLEGVMKAAKIQSEVEELVRAGAEKAWGDGYEAGYDAGGEPEWPRAGGPLGYGDNPHRKPTTDTTEAPNE